MTYRPRLPADDPRLAAPDFPHGDPRGYNRGCPCVECRTATTRESAQRRARRNGVPIGRPMGPSVDAGPARDAIAAWIDLGFSMLSVAQAATVAETTVQGIRSGRYQRVRENSSVAILAVDLDDMIEFARLIPTPLVLAHVERLLDVEGASMARIARIAGITGETLRKLVHGHLAGVKNKTATRLLAVTPAQVYEHGRYLIPARPAYTRIKALSANGWPLAAIAPLLGRAATADDDPTMGVDSMITVEFDAIIAKVYAQIGDQPGGNATCAARARRDGYFPPIYYDDDMNLIPVDDDDDRVMVARDSIRSLGYLTDGYSGAQTARMIGRPTKFVERRRGYLRVSLLRANPTAVDFADPVGRLRPEVAPVIRAIRPLIEEIAYRHDADGWDSTDDVIALWAKIKRVAQEVAEPLGLLLPPPKDAEAKGDDATLDVEAA